MEFLEKHKINSREELAEYRKPLEEQVLLLTKERYRLYRAAPQSARIADITRQLKELRKEIRICVKIDKHSQEMEEKLKRLEQKELAPEDTGQEKAGKERNGLEERR